MKKQYMDFVPAGRAAVTKTAPKAVTTRKPAARVARPISEVAKPVARPTRQVAKRPAASKPAMKEVPAVSFTGERKLGVVEDMSAKFVKTDVPKRPLSTKPHFRSTGVTALKAEKVGLKADAHKKTEVKPVEKPVEKSATRTAKNTFQTPMTPFINQGKIEKRPLSKNVYEKKIVAMEEPKGPVTIISKPDSGSHVGLVVTIILTIILGAAAGTVAFLLLPK